MTRLDLATSAAKGAASLVPLAGQSASLSTRTGVVAILDAMRTRP